MKINGVPFLIATAVLVTLTGVFIDYGWRAVYWVGSASLSQFTLMLWGMTQMSNQHHERERRDMERLDQLHRAIQRVWEKP